MKQYTTPEQTAKLMELGFEEPKSIGGYEPTFVVEYEGVEVSNVIIGENKQCPIFAYSIGELIEMLPKGIGDDYLDISAPFGEDNGWLITYGQQVYEDWEELYTFINNELIDALYDIVVKLKEEGVI